MRHEPHNLEANSYLKCARDTWKNPPRAGRTESKCVGIRDSHLFCEVIMRHFHSQKALVDRRPGEAVVEQEAMLFRSKE